jgi:uncharacterized protein
MIDAAQEHHRAVGEAFRRLAPDETFLTHNYVVVEACALLQGRLGTPAVRTLLDDVVPAMEVVWVHAEVHASAAAALLAAGKRGVSLVDWVSFEVMRLHGATRALTLDDDFARQGFETIP